MTVRDQLESLSAIAGIRTPGTKGADFSNEMAQSPPQAELAPSMTAFVLPA
jgi:hypothetical protein